jgi:hypothetical protein
MNSVGVAKTRDLPSARLLAPGLAECPEAAPLRRSRLDVTVV